MSCNNPLLSRLQCAKQPWQARLSNREFCETAPASKNGLAEPHVAVDWLDWLDWLERLARVMTGVSLCSVPPCSPFPNFNHPPPAWYLFNAFSTNTQWSTSDFLMRSDFFTSKTVPFRGFLAELRRSDYNDNHSQGVKNTSSQNILSNLKESRLISPETDTKLDHSLNISFTHHRPLQT